MNLVEIKAVLSKDAVMGRIIQQLDLDFQPQHKPTDLYHSLVRSIISQQLSVKAAETIYGRFLSLFENQYPSKEKLLAMDIVTLKSKGLSTQKANYVKNIAAYFSEPMNSNEKWLEMSNQKVLSKLTSIKGVGQWTVEMILMFTLNRPDILPLGDLGIQNGMKALYNIEVGNKKELFQEMTQIAENWRPYRTYACRYVWAAKDLL